MEPDNDKVKNENKEVDTTIDEMIKLKQREDKKNVKINNNESKKSKNKSKDQSKTIINEQEDDDEFKRKEKELLEIMFKENDNPKIKVSLNKKGLLTIYNILNNDIRIYFYDDENNIQSLLCHKKTTRSFSVISNFVTMNDGQVLSKGEFIEINCYKIWNKTEQNDQREFRDSKIRGERNINENRGDRSINENIHEQKEKEKEKIIVKSKIEERKSWADIAEEEETEEIQKELAYKLHILETFCLKNGLKLNYQILKLSNNNIIFTNMFIRNT